MYNSYHLNYLIIWITSKSTDIPVFELFFEDITVIASV